MNVVAVPCFQDNYAYVAYVPGATGCVVVDPSEEEPVRAVLRARDLRVEAILCTHHHGDHVDGVEAIAAASEGVRVFAHVRDRERTPGVTDTVEHGDVIVAAGIELGVIHVPGHTLGAVTWVARGCAFTGDTLFLGGCGRVFEGTAEMMYGSLHGRLAALPLATRIYCGHEYTESNLVFACAVEPGNTRLRDRLAATRQKRGRGEPTVPATLAEELETNPFLRCEQPEVIGYALAHGAKSSEPAAVFAALRQSKNVFRG